MNPSPDDSRPFVTVVLSFPTGLVVQASGYDLKLAVQSLTQQLYADATKALDIRDRGEELLRG